MRKEVSQPAMIAIVTAVVVVILALGWYIINRQPPTRTPGEAHGSVQAKPGNGAKGMAAERGVDVP